jgi:hypothetical protein
MNCRILSWFVEQTELGGLVILICVYVCVEIFSVFFFWGLFSLFELCSTETSLLSHSWVEAFQGFGLSVCVGFGFLLTLKIYFSLFFFNCFNVNDNGPLWDFFI